MKKILFVINNFCIGGIQRSLIELLSVISDEYEIYVYATDTKGPYLNQIPDNVRILNSSRFAKMLEYSRWNYRKVGGFWNYLAKLFLGWFSSKYGRKFPARFYCKIIGKIPGEYDWAISFSQPLGDKTFHNLENEIVLFCTDAHYRATFVHCDYEEYGGNTSYNHNLYKQFDAVAAVSQSVAEKFCRILPDQKNKVCVVYNACDSTFIQTQSLNNPIQYKKKCIISVCRLSPVKGLLRCVPIFHQLMEEHYEFEWHIVGGGDKKYVTELTNAINNYGLKDIIILEGDQINPYRFMKYADFLLLPSYHEAAPMVYNEACCLGLRILTTNTLSANEMVSNRGIGLVCNNDENSIYLMLKRAMCEEISAYMPDTMKQWNNTVKSQFRKMIYSDFEYDQVPY